MPEQIDIFNNHLFKSEVQLLQKQLLTIPNEKGIGKKKTTCSEISEIEAVMALITLNDMISNASSTVTASWTVPGGDDYRNPWAV